jgi:hypothetical protein
MAQFFANWRPPLTIPNNCGGVAELSNFTDLKADRQEWLSY